MLSRALKILLFCYMTSAHAQYLIELEKPTWLTPVDISQGYYLGLTPEILKVASKPVTPQIDSSVQGITDSLAMSLFRTPWGQQLCQIVFQRDAKKLNYFLGVGHEVAQAIASSCEDLGLLSRPLNTQDRSNAMPHVFTYLFVPEKEMQQDPHMSRIKSYSFSTSLSVLLVDEEAFTSENLVSSFLHEIAVLFDTKAFIWPQEIEDRQEVVKQAPDLTKLPPTFRWLDVSDKGIDPSVLAAAANPEVSYAFLILRAMAVEKLVYPQLEQFQFDQDFDEPLKKFFALPCEQRLELALQKMRVFRAMRWQGSGAVYDLLFGRPPRIDGEDENLYLERRLDEAVRVIKTARVKLKNQEISACEYYSIPELGTDFIRLNYGPRPRWSGW